MHPRGFGRSRLGLPRGKYGPLYSPRNTAAPLRYTRVLSPGNPEVPQPGDGRPDTAVPRCPGRCCRRPPAGPGGGLPAGRPSPRIAGSGSQIGGALPAGTGPARWRSLARVACAVVPGSEGSGTRRRSGCRSGCRVVSSWTISTLGQVGNPTTISKPCPVPDCYGWVTGTNCDYCREHQQLVNLFGAWLDDLQPFCGDSFDDARAVWEAAGR